MRNLNLPGPAAAGVAEADPDPIDALARDLYDVILDDYGEDAAVVDALKGIIEEGCREEREGGLEEAGAAPVGAAAEEAAAEAAEAAAADAEAADAAGADVPDGPVLPDGPDAAAAPAPEAPGEADRAELQALTELEQALLDAGLRDLKLPGHYRFVGLHDGRPRGAIHVMGGGISA